MATKRKRRNPDNRPALGAFLGSAIGMIPGAALRSPWLFSIGSAAGGALGGYYGASERYKKGAALGGGVGGMVLGPIGAPIGGYIGGRTRRNPSTAGVLATVLGTAALVGGGYAAYRYAQGKPILPAGKPELGPGAELNADESKVVYVWSPDGSDGWAWAVAPVDKWQGPPPATPLVDLEGFAADPFPSEQAAREAGRHFANTGERLQPGDVPPIPAPQLYYSSDGSKVVYVYQSGSPEQWGWMVATVANWNGPPPMTPLEAFDGFALQPLPSEEAAAEAGIHFADTGERIS